MGAMPKGNVRIGGGNRMSCSFYLFQWISRVVTDREEGKKTLKKRDDIYDRFETKRHARTHARTLTHTFTHSHIRTSTHTKAMDLLDFGQTTLTLQSTSPSSILASPLATVLAAVLQVDAT